MQGIPLDMQAEAPLSPSITSLALLKEACDACSGGELGTIPPLLLRAFLNCYVAHHMKDIQLRGLMRVAAQGSLYFQEVSLANP